MDNFLREIEQSVARDAERRAAKEASVFDHASATEAERQEYTSDVMHAAARIRTWAKAEPIRPISVGFEVRGHAFVIEIESGKLLRGSDGKAVGYTSGNVLPEPSQPREIRSIEAGEA